MNNFKKTQEILIEAQIKASKDAIMHYQSKNKVSWDDAKKSVENAIKSAIKIARGPRVRKAAKPAKPREKFMTDKQFAKVMKGAASDFQSDNPEVDLGDIAYDMAGSIMYDPEIEKYVRMKIGKNTGRAPDQVKRADVQDYIADSIYG